MILSEFMYLFPENEKIIIYKSIFQYYEEMFYNFYYFDQFDFVEGLNNLNNGLSYDVLDYFFDNYDNIYSDNYLKVDNIIIDYFFKYTKTLYDNNKDNKISYQNFLYDICINKSLNLGDNKINRIYKCYLLFMNNNNCIDKDKLYQYYEDNYLHLKELNDNIKIQKLKDYLYLK